MLTLAAIHARRHWLLVWCCSYSPTRPFSASGLAMKSYFTTPIYYVNDRPHIGHAYTTILTDAITRWHRQAGCETFLLTGVDEHGQKVQRAADARGMTPQAHCDEMHLAFKDLWPELHIDYTRFIRTTEDEHKRVVQGALQQLRDADLIYAKEYGGWYSVSEERFWTEKDLVDGKCPLSGNPVEWIEEKNYFFKMSQYQESLVAHIHANPHFIRPEHRKNEVLGFLREPLHDLCISRPKSRLSWGIELPFDSDYVTYVWFDALINYLTGIGYPDGDWQGWWADAVHLLGKDILTTHCVYWTTMLQGLGIPLPKGLLAHGWWLMDDAKMSKTKGNVVDPMALKDRYGVEVFRYYLLREMSVGQDANFSEVGLVGRNNSELANTLGNLANRTLNMVEKRFDAKVPEYSKSDPAEDDELTSAIEGLDTEIERLLDRYAVHRAIEACMSLARAANKYLNDTVPFKVVKTDPERAGSQIHLVIRALERVAYWLQPAMPEAMTELTRRIGVVDGALQVGATVEKGAPLFPTFDPPALEEEPSKAEPTPEAVDEPKYLEFDDFLKIELRVAKVLAAEKVPKADKLLKLQVDLGDDKRQVVAGIAKSYEPEQLVGKEVVMVANLKPRKIFGLKSQGMILAARDGQALFVVTPDGDVAPGAGVS